MHSCSSLCASRGAGYVGLRFETPTQRDAGWLVIGALCTAAVLVGARLNGVWDRQAWRVVALGQALVTGGAAADLISRQLRGRAGIPLTRRPALHRGLRRSRDRL